MTIRLVGLAASVVFLGAVADAALSDLGGFRIPNRDPLLLAGAFLGTAALPGAGGEGVLLHCAAGIVVFTIGAALFHFGVWGGGDAKLLAACALWSGFVGLPRLLMVMALAGGAVAILTLIVRRLPCGKPEWLKMLRERLAGTGHVPYGIAIAAAALDWWAATMLPALGG